MLLLMQGIITIEGTVYILSSVSALIKLHLCASLHMVYVAWTEVMIVY